VLLNLPLFDLLSSLLRDADLAVVDDFVTDFAGFFLVVDDQRYIADVYGQVNVFFATTGIDPTGADVAFFDIDALDPDLAVTNSDNFTDSASVATGDDFH
jgi:hypothetical protein